MAADQLPPLAKGSILPLPSNHHFSLHFPLLPPCLQQRRVAGPQYEQWASPLPFPTATPSTLPSLPLACSSVLSLTPSASAWKQRAARSQLPLLQQAAAAGRHLSWPAQRRGRQTPTVESQPKLAVILASSTLLLPTRYHNQHTSPDNSSPLPLHAGPSLSTFPSAPSPARWPTHPPYAERHLRRRREPMQRERLPHPLLWAHCCQEARCVIMEPSRQACQG